MSQQPPVIPLIIRGEVITDHLVGHTVRGSAHSFLTPDVGHYVDRLPLSSPSALRDLHEIPFEGILDCLAELGKRLTLDDNPHLRQAFDLACVASGTPRPVLERLFASIPAAFDPDVIRETADRVVGLDYLNSWVPTTLADGMTFEVRAFGTRTAHIIAGNTPFSGASTVIRTAMLRSDAIIKQPSNAPGGAAAVVRTLCEFAPDHPLTRHLAVAYWKGGDESVEARLYHPDRLERLVAWGGEPSMRHIRRYIRPGLDLVALDPKLGASIIGAGAFADEVTLREAATRLATDIGSLNQQSCANPRVVYVQCGLDDDGLDRLRRLGQLTVRALHDLPPDFSSPADRMDGELRASLDAATLASDWYEVIGCTGTEGGVILSLEPEPVDFAAILDGRVANLVPVDDLATAVLSTNAYTQTVGVYPEELKADLRDDLALHGVQRLVSLGHAVEASWATPHDGMEPMRRICKWVVDEHR